MKFKITEKINCYDGGPFFSVYKWEPTLRGREDHRWSFKHGTRTLAEAREFISLQVRLSALGAEEKVIEEVEV